MSTTGRALRVAILGINYAPECSGIGPYTSRLAAGLTARGHAVRVLTGYPHYPHWVRSEPGTLLRRDENIDGIPVRRLKHYVPRGGSWVGRAVMELTYGLQLLTSRWGDPDVIVCVTPPLISAGLAALRVRLCVGRPALGMLIHDLYGRGVIEMGVLPGMPSRVIGSVESATLRMADGVAVIHAGFADLLETSGVPRSRIREIRNWTHVLSPDPLASAQFRRAHHWQPDEIVVLHAGNMGHKQGLENVVAAAGFAARNGQRVRFVLLGDGSQRLHLEQAGAGLPTLEFLAPVGEGEFPAALGAADVLLVNERPGVALMAVPSKLTSYFRSGKPIVAATDAAGLTAAELAASGAGIVVPADRPEELVRAALRLGEHRELADQLAAAGQRYCDAMLSEDTAMDRYEAWIMDLAKLRRRGDRSSHER